MRVNIPSASLRETLQRPNITLLTGITFVMDGAVHGVSANARVIRSAGAINTPKILMQAGIGPVAHLHQAGVNVVHDLPGARQNFQDHIMVAGCIREFNTPEALRNSGAGATFFWKADSALDTPDLQPFQFEVPAVARTIAPGLVRHSREVSGGFPGFPECTVALTPPRACTIIAGKQERSRQGFRCPVAALPNDRGDSGGGGGMPSIGRRTFLAMAGASSLPLAALGQVGTDARTEVLRSWYRMILELVRHTPTYSPPVASRAFAYTALIAYEAVASGGGRLRTLAGQLTGIPPTPLRAPGARHDEPAVLNAALARGVEVYFANTGPTGQRAKAALGRQLDALVADGLDEAVLARSRAYGRAIADTIIAASESDGGAVVDNMGFPETFALDPTPGHWVPTSAVRLQQSPLLPDWGNNRPLALPDGVACPLPPPPDYSEVPGSAFHTEALEVYEVSRSLVEEQLLIARFWSDDPMLSPTPPGHWIAIVLQIAERDALPVETQVDALVRLGIAVSDGFIVCWRDKFLYDLVRPVTYIRRVIDPGWQPLLITPPFPEYPSGHSTQSGAAAQVLTHVFGDPFPFADSTHVDDGLPAREFTGFWHAAEEAGISRLYGGIHFRAAIERGLVQGACVGDRVNGLKTWA